MVLNNKITGLSSNWLCSLMGAFPSRGIPTCRFSSALAKQQVGFTHLVKEIIIINLSDQCTKLTCYLHPILQTVKVFY